MEESSSAHKSTRAEDAHDVIYRHVLWSRANTVPFGTSNLYVTEDRGSSWQTISNSRSS